MANSITLADWAQHSKEPAVKKLINDMLRDQRSLFDKIPFTPVGSVTVRNQTYKGLPSLAFRPIGQSNYSALTAGDVVDVVASVYDLGGVHTIDHILMKDQNRLRDPRAFEMDRARESAVRLFNKQFVLGLANSPDGFPGLDDWLADNTSQIKDRGSAAIWASQASLDSFIDDMFEMFTYIADNRPDVILTNLQGRLALESTLRRANYLKTVTDQWDRHFATFDGVPIVDVGSKSGDRGASDYIIPYTSSTTSLYFVKFGPDFVQGLQMEPLSIDDIGYTSESDRTVYKIVIHWVVGLMISHRYSVAKLANCKFAAS